MRYGREVAALALGLSLCAVAACTRDGSAAGEAPRTVEPRLSTATAHTPCRVEPVPGQPLPRVHCRQVPLERATAAWRHRQRQLDGASGAVRDHAAALWSLVYGSGRATADPDGARRAVEALEGAVRRQPDTPRWLSDLAAARFVSAHDEQRAAGLVAALDAAARALALAPELPEARFNRTLVLERLGLCPQAAGAWADSAAREPESAWGREAARRRQALHCRPPDWRPLTAWVVGGGGEDLTDRVPPDVLDLLARHPAETVKRALADLFPLWADARLAGDDATATRRLHRLHRLGAELQRRSGDRTVSLAAAHLEAAAPDRRHRLARAHSRYGQAAERQSASAYQEAAALFRRAAEAALSPPPEAAAEEAPKKGWGRAVAPPGGAPKKGWGSVRGVVGDPSEGPSPLVFWARYGTVVSLVTAGENAAALAEIAALRTVPGLTDHLPALAARFHWSQGLVEVRTGAFAASRASYRAAARAFAALGDAGQRDAVRALEAESLHSLGLAEAAWETRLGALRTLGRTPGGSLHNLLLDAAIAAREDGLPHAALELQTAGLETARALGSTSRTLEALLWRSRALADLGRHGDALADLDDALSLTGTLTDPAVRRRLTADVHEARGTLLQDRDPAAAVAALDRAVPLYRQTRYAWKLPTTLLARARAHRRLGDHRRAETDLEAALTEFERRDRALPPQVLRYSHFERAQQIFDEMIRLQVDRDRPRAALAYAERARRARWPEPAAPSAGAATPAPLRSLVGAVPPGTAVVEMMVTADRLFTWVVHGGDVHFHQQPLADLEPRVEAYWRALATPAPALAEGDGTAAELETMAEELHRRLAAPWINTLPPRTRLVFVPDRFLHRLPFAALRDEGRGHWLGDTHVIATAPSLAFAAGAGRHGSSAATPGTTAATAATAATDGTPLLVAAPAFDPDETGPLPPLPGALREAAELRRLYPHATVLTGADATRPAVLAALERADLVHYAGHGLTNPARPWVSILPLAPPAAGGTGLLTAGEIHDRLPPRHRRAVVLSACGIASDGRQRAAGFTALVEAFLATGTDAVVASLWSVDDRAVVPLTVELHRGLRAGLPAADALHTARRRYRQRFPEATPHHWAGLQVAGVADPGSIHRTGQRR